MNLDPEKDVTCRACNATFKLKDSLPCLSPYNDIRCPHCGSTNNEHNSEYQRGIFKK